MPQRNLLILLVAIVASYICYVHDDHDPYCRYVASGLSDIRENALDPPPSRALFDSAMDGMIDVLRQRGDPHSQFLSESEAGPLRNEIHQQFGGIGIRIKFEGEPPQLVIAGPIAPTTPAGRAKLRPGDRILKINGEATAGLSRREVLARISGEPGTALQLTVRSEHELQPRTVELVRDVIQIDSIAGDRRGPDGEWLFALQDDPRIAQVRILSFGDRTASEFSALMPRLVEKGVRAVILDLRDNAGGSLSAAVAVCEALLPAGKMIVETRGRGQVLRQRYATKSDGKYCEFPLAVIVNQNSASASEIVAACLQDQHRAIVAGERSFGKGTVQQLLPIGKSLLKLTWASFWRPSGANIHHAVGAAADAVWGVSPDAGYERKLSADEYAAYRSFRDQRDENGEVESAAYVDGPLELAEQYLQHQLGSNP
ncbi:MAG TPA: S41 family peptidase [Lacipirellulaceae bacterium]|nr:S41 family peptidase [Lacipirellulaceae bacterium]